MKTLAMVRSTLVALICAISLNAHAVADDLKSITVPAGDLAAALEALGKQFGIDVVYPSEQVRGLKTSGFSGQLDAQAALTKLLEGTPLRIKRDAAGAFLIVATLPASAPRTTGRPLTTANGSLHIAGAAADEKSSASEPGASEADSELPADDTAGAKGVEVIEVIGSRLLTSESERPVAIRTLDRAELDASGATTVGHALNSLPEVSVSSNGTLGNTGDYGARTVQLRGLPVGSTLMLVNGRRLPISAFQSSFGFFDLNAIPLDLVERIEVLATGSSAVYGGDALGGVVNIVLSKRTEGLRVSARYGGSEGYVEREAGLALGWNSARWALSAVAAYGSNNELVGSERELTATDDKRSFGGTDARLVAGNVYSRTSANLPGLNSRFAAVPVGSTGIGLTPQDFSATAGTLNRISINPPRSLVPTQERFASFVYGTFAASENLELFLELLWSKSDVVTAIFEPILFDGQTGNFVAPASNPFNPFGVDVGVDFQFDGVGRPTNTLDATVTRPVLGARGSFGDWTWELAGSRTATEEHETSSGRINNAAVRAALAETDPSRALNVFQDGPGGPRAVTDPLFQTLLLDSESRSTLLGGHIRGPLLTLASRNIDVVLGGEHERNVLDRSLSNQRIRGDRQVSSAFAEVRIPLVIGTARGTSAALLALTGAGRYDDYSDFGDRTSVGTGLEYRPVRDLLFRGSYGTTFKPPLMHLLHFAQTTFTHTITDPVRGGERYLVTFISGGNPNLLPQTGWSRTFGTVFSPKAVPTLELTVTDWRTNVRNSSTARDVQFIVDNAGGFPGRITRGPATPGDPFPAGRITLLDGSPYNVGFVDVAGTDFSVDWKRTIGRIEFAPTLSLTHTRRYRVSVSPGVVTDQVSKANAVGFAPKWKGQVALSMKLSALNVTASANYIGYYEDYGASTTDLGDFWVCNLNAGFGLGKAFGSSHPLLEDTFISAGALNLFDREPQFSPGFFLGFDPRQSDLRGRLVYAQIATQF